MLSLREVSRDFDVKIHVVSLTKVVKMLFTPFFKTKSSSDRVHAFSEWLQSRSWLKKGCI